MNDSVNFCDLQIPADIYPYHTIDKTVDTIVARAPLALLAVNANGCVIWCSPLPQMHNSLRNNTATWLNRDLIDILPLVHGEQQAWQACLRGNSGYVKFMLESKLVHGWFYPLHDTEDTSQGIAGILFDTGTSEPNHQILAEHTTDVITKHNMDGVIHYASPSVTRLLGYAPDELLGVTVFDLFHPDDAKSARKKFFGTDRDFQPNEAIHYRIRAKSGDYIWFETLRKLVIDTATQATKEVVAVSRDITERKMTEDRLMYLANFDSLTGLPNRALFRDRLRRAIARAQRNNGQVALLFLDLDRFKNINDSLGHHAGDQLLRGVSKRLLKNAREGDTVARLGGDEFTVILEGIESSEDAVAVARKILELMEAPFKLDGHEIVVSTSIGITLYPEDATDMSSLLKNADTAMYRTKEKGRNSYQFYTADMNDKAIETLMLENDLRHALEREEFELYFQPQFDLHTRAIIGIEALVRWNHPVRGLLSPSKFIPFAEESGLIIAMGEWILRKACTYARAWQSPGHAPLHVAVNLSMRQFHQRNLVEMVTQALADSGLPPYCLELEITESMLAHNVEKTSAILHELHNLGIRLSIDDFGTGYSSLNYLKRFPLNTLKIAQSFVQDIANEPDDAAIAEAIIGLAKALRLNVIAEGVETDEQVYFLRGRGCDWVQGELFSKPIPSQDLLPWLRRNRPHFVVYQQGVLWPDAAHA